MKKIIHMLTVTALGLATIAPAQAADRQLSYQGGGYAVYWNGPQNCTLETTTAKGAAVRIVYDASDSWINFYYARAGLPAVRENASFPVNFKFDSAAPVNLPAFENKWSATGNGFSVTIDEALLTKWGKGSQVAIRLSDGKNSVIETVALSGSGAAIHHLEACIHPRYTVTVAPPPPGPDGTPQADYPDQDMPMTLLGRFAIACDNGRTSYYVGTTLIGRAMECSEDGLPHVAQEKSFPNNRQIILVQSLGGMASEGSIILLAQGQKPKLLPVEYVTEFGAIQSDTKLTTTTQGVVDPNGPACTIVMQLTLDWAAGTATENMLSHEGACG